jgi:signal transduction histidine kinase/ligand-binding sensor domain-containing protein
MRIFILVSIIAGVFLGNIFSYASEVLYNRNDQTGLTFLYVSDIAKDEKGFMWFGTTRGLSRWDGYKYNYYFSNANDNTSLSNNKVEALLIDEDDFLWVGTSHGLNKYDPRTDSFIHYFYSGTDSNSLSDNSISRIGKDKSGNLWIGTHNGITCFDSSRKIFQRIEYQKYLPTDTDPQNYKFIRSLFIDSEGMVWIGFNYSGILKYDPVSKTGQFFLYDDNGNFISSVNDIAEINNDWILAGTWGNKVFSISKKTNSIKPWEGNKYLISSIVDFIRTDSKGNIWIADHYSKILHISPNLKIINQYSSQSFSNNIPSNQISAIYTEKDKIWFGTINQGFFQIAIQDKLIKNLSPKNLTNPIQISAITNGKTGEILIGSPDGRIFSYNEERNELNIIPVNYRMIASLFYDETTGFLFPGIYSNKLFSLNPNNLNTNTYHTYPSGFTQNNFAGDADNIFISQWRKGIQKLSRNGEITFLGTNEWEQTFSTMQLTLDENDLWIATIDHGIVWYNVSTNQFKSFPIKGESISLTPTNQVNIIKILKNGRILAYTNELGLCSFNRENGIYTQLGKEVGLNRIHIKAIIEDELDNIWIVAEQKVIKTNYRFNSFSVYSMRDGLNFGIEHLAATYSSFSKRIYFGGQEGIQFINTNETSKQSEISKVVITDVRIFEKSVSQIPSLLKKKSISYIDSIELSYKQNFITIDFSAMRHSELTNLQYSYKMEGINSDWVIVPYNQNSVTYSNIKPGHYTFQIKISNEHGTWSDAITQLHVRISPPLWGRLWFRILVFVIVMVAILLFFKYREFKYLSENKKLESIVSERTSEILETTKLLEKQKNELVKANEVKNKFFSIIAHDLRNPVSSIVQLIEYIHENFNSLSREQHKKMVETSVQSANSTLNLLEDLLIWAQTQTNKITYVFEKLNIQEIVKAEINNIAQLAFNKNIEIKNNILPTINVYADNNSVKTIIRNLLTNAIKFSHKNSLIKIGSHIRDNYVIIYIKDNGTGMSNETFKNLFKINKERVKEGTDGEHGTGLGLSLCQEFITKNGGEIWAESELNVGSTFFFSLPLFKEK